MTLRLVIALTVLAHLAFVGSRVTVSLHAIALGATPLTVGVLMSLYAALPMLLAVHAGRRIDRGGSAGPLLAGLLAVAAGVLLPFAWPGLAALFVAATAIGTGFLFVHVALNNVAGALGAPEERAASFAWLALGFSVGGFFGPLAAGFAIDGLGHRLAFLVLAVFPLSAAGILWRRRRRVPAHVAPKADDRERHVADLLRDARLRHAFIASAVLAMAGTCTPSSCRSTARASACRPRSSALSWAASPRRPSPYASRCRCSRAACASGAWWWRR